MYIEKQLSGRTTLSLSMPDASGNYGYSLTFNYMCGVGELSETIRFSKVEFSGPGSWVDYSEGEDYPYHEMERVVLDEMTVDTN